jgi:glycosyltransferase involved in cell wall biosynthesis
MKTIIPYIIRHIALHDFGQKEFFKLDEGDRFYLVFWWRSLALGDLYIDKCGYNKFELQQTIFNAIMPALKSYLTNSSEIDLLRKYYLYHDFRAFVNLMDECFKEFHQELLPSNVEISVVICTRNRSTDLDICLQNLTRQRCLPSEIIVVDNAPLDSSTEEVARKYDLVKYYCEPRAGLDFARNTGVKASNFPIIAFCDDDVKVHSDWSYRVWETFQDNSVAAMTGLIISYSLETESQQIFEKHWGFNKGYGQIIFDYSTIQDKPPRVWDIGAGANMAFRKAAIEGANYFDERLGAGASGCGDDSEMWYRILLQGGVIKYNPKAISFHEHRKDMKSLHKQLFSYMRGHVAAALFQHKENPGAGYKKYIFLDLPKYYLFLTRIGFPNYEFRYSTLWSEFKGILSGVRFYLQNKKRPRISQQ